jgi:hypothetical protein
MSEDFKWTDELYKEWGKFYVENVGDYNLLIEEFIKQQKQKANTNNDEWEIVAFKHNSSDYILAFGSWERKDKYNGNARLYDAVLSGKKTFEVRKNDRDFREGDILLLNKWDNVKNEYAGSQTAMSITYVLVGGQFGIEPGYCVLGLKPIRCR